MRIVNLTQHKATPAQREEGVFDLPPDQQQKVVELLNFDSPASFEEIDRRAYLLSQIAKASGADAAMIGGALWLMGPLELALVREQVKPLYAFSKRESIDVPQPDGSTKKEVVFRHIGWQNGVLTMFREVSL